MNVDIIEAAALQFGHGKPMVSNLGNRLIHHTYKVGFTGEGNSGPIVLQNINRHMFKHPENIIYNYRLVYDAIGTGQRLTYSTFNTYP